MVRPEKVAAVAEIKEKLAKSNAIILTDYRGLNVQAITELRRQMKEAGVEYKVIKNTLARFAAREAGLENIEQFLEGPTAAAFGYDDPVIPAKVIAEFAKKYKQLEVKGGLLAGKVLQKEKVKELADLPPKEILLGKVLGGMMSPISGLANVLSGTPRSLVYTLEAIRKQKEATG